jgi:hypothetical protein
MNKYMRKRERFFLTKEYQVLIIEEMCEIENLLYYTIAIIVGIKPKLVGKCLKKN